MATALAGSVVCCSCLGIGALVRWRYESRRSAQKQRYLPVKSMEEDFDDDDDDVIGDEDAGEDVIALHTQCPLCPCRAVVFAANGCVLLFANSLQDFLELGDSSAAAAATESSSEHSTPAGRPSRPSTTLSATSANWVDEMNAELAEFDNLASSLVKTPGSLVKGMPHRK